MFLLFADVYSGIAEIDDRKVKKIQISGMGKISKSTIQKVMADGQLTVDNSKIENIECSGDLIIKSSNIKTIKIRGFISIIKSIVGEVETYTQKVEIKESKIKKMVIRKNKDKIPPEIMISNNSKVEEIILEDKDTKIICDKTSTVKTSS